MLRLRREHERAAQHAVDDELVNVGSLDGAELSMRAMHRLQQLLGRATHRRGADAGLLCTITPSPGADTVVTCPEGMLTLHDRQIVIERDPLERDPLRNDPLDNAQAQDYRTEGDHVRV